MTPIALSTFATRPTFHIPKSPPGLAPLANTTFAKMADKTKDLASVLGHPQGLHERSDHLGNDEKFIHGIPIQKPYRLLPSDRHLNGCPFQLSDPAEYKSTLQELKEPGYSNSSGFVAEKISNYTFLLHVVPPNNFGELSVELIAVFEGDVLSHLS